MIFKHAFKICLVLCRHSKFIGALTSIRNPIKASPAFENRLRSHRIIRRGLNWLLKVDKALTGF